GMRHRPDVRAGPHTFPLHARSNSYNGEGRGKRSAPPPFFIPSEATEEASVMSPGVRTIGTKELLDGLHIVHQTLDLWQAEGCPPLGHKLEPVEGGGRGVERRWPLEDYERLAAIPVVAHDGHVMIGGRWFVMAGEAAARCRRNVSRVEAWRDAPCMWIGRP